MNSALKKIGLVVLVGFALIGVYSLVLWFSGTTSQTADLSSIAVIVQDQNNDLVFENPQLVWGLRLIVDQASGKSILVNSPVEEEVPLVEAALQP